MTAVTNQRRSGHLAKAVFPALMALMLAGCTDGEGFDFLKPRAEAGQDVDGVIVDTPQGEMIERDVEAPEVFEASEAGLWDGRPSLGGIWVAHPNVSDPERVLIRNNTNGKFVIGALFRREREIPGPRFQVSSDAAAELGMLAGAPVELTATALRREVVPVEVPAPVAVETAEALPDAGAIDASEIDAAPLDPIASAEAAIIKAEESAAPTAAATAPSAPVAAPQPPKVSGLTKPFIQIGIFSIEANANRTAGTLRNAGIVPTVLKQSSKGKTFWRVVVGPATSKTERSDLLKIVKKQGFTDAYFVTN